jgi:hypothetical protein
MSLQTTPGKLVLLLTSIALLLTTAAAGSIDAKDGVLWLNRLESNPNTDPTKVEATATCLSSGSVHVDGSHLANITNTTYEITSQDFTNRLGAHQLQLQCNGTTHNETITAKRLDISITQDSKGFVDEKLGGQGFVGAASLQSVELEIEVETRNGTEQLTGDDRQDLSFSIDSAKSRIQNSRTDVKLFPDGTIELNPYVSGFIHPDIGVDLKTTYDNGGPITITQEVYPTIYHWKLTTLKRPAKRQMDFEDVENGEFTYTFDADYSGFQSSEGLFEENFKLDITGINAPGFKDRTDLEWLTTDNPDNKDYRLTLERTDDLPAGLYKFTVKAQYEAENGNTHEFVIDTLRVENTLSFSGRVHDSARRGVKTVMDLAREGSPTLHITTGNDGRYSKDIDMETSIKSGSIKFYDRGKEKSDATFTLNNPQLADPAEIEDSQAIGFQYWNDPPKLGLAGLQPVNMMAVKFAHHIGGAQASMQFDPTNLRFDQIRVYECSYWNFFGQTCLGEWSAMSDNQVNLNLAQQEANLANLQPHRITESVGGSEKDILMNAYVLGVPAPLTLEDSLQITGLTGGERIKSEGEIGISGVLVSGAGETKRVEDANVTVTLMRGQEAIKGFTATTDAQGQFKVTGTAPEEPGSYDIKVEANKEPFTSFSLRSDRSIQVFLTSGLTLDTPSSPVVYLGNESRVTATLENTGQAEVTDIEMSIGEIDKQLFTLENVPESLAPGESVDIPITLNLPENFCSYPCRNAPVLDIDVDAKAGEEKLKATAAVYTQINLEPPSGSQDTQRSDSSSSQDNQNGGSDQDSSTQSAARQANQSDEQDSNLFSDVANTPTGQFIRSQSDVNIALGLIFIFTVILAMAIKRKNNGMSDRRNGNGMRQSNGMNGARRDKVATPQLSNGGPDNGSHLHWSNGDNSSDSLEASQDSVGQENELNMEQPEDEEIRDEPDTAKADVDEGAGESEEPEEDYYDEERDVWVCGETGDEFDTEAALELYKKINDLN